MDDVHCVDTKSMLTETYESCIKVQGRRILPPVVTDEFRKRVKKWQQEAIALENYRASKRKSTIEKYCQDIGNICSSDIQTSNCTIVEKPLGNNDASLDVKVSMANSLLDSMSQICTKEVLLKQSADVSGRTSSALCSIGVNYDSSGLSSDSDQEYDSIPVKKSNNSAHHDSVRSNDLSAAAESVSTNLGNYMVDGDSLPTTACSTSRTLVTESQSGAGTTGLVRSRSFVLESPSPALLDALQTHPEMATAVQPRQVASRNERARSTRRERATRRSAGNENTDDVEAIARAKFDHLKEYLRQLSLHSTVEDDAPQTARSDPTTVTADPLISPRTSTSAPNTARGDDRDRERGQSDVNITHRRRQNVLRTDGGHVGSDNQTFTVGTDVADTERSPRRQATSRVVVNVPPQVLQPDMQKKLARVSAVVKGVLTRRLLETEKVKSIRKTVVDTIELAVKFQDETPVRRGQVTTGDATLQSRLMAQLHAALQDVHHKFFVISKREQMNIISQDRAAKQQKRLFEQAGFKSNINRRRKVLSSATVKTLERKLGREKENSEPLVSQLTKKQKRRTVHGEVKAYDRGGRVSVKEVTDRLYKPRLDTTYHAVSSRTARRSELHPTHTDIMAVSTKGKKALF